MRKRRLFVAMLAAVTLIAASCGDDDDDSSAEAGDETEDTTASTKAETTVPAGALKELGAGEGAVNVIAWAGYVEDGSTDPATDWITGFEKESGCNVTVKLGATSDEMVTLMKSGEYDGVSASGDATLRLIDGGDVVPVNTDLIPNYADVFSGLKGQPHNTIKGVPYGIPHGRGANLLMYRTDKVSPAPTSWGVVWDEKSPNKGKVTAYDSPIYIADAAVYLKHHQPDLKIDDVYELDDTQFKAAVDLLKKQRTVIGEYWSDYTKSQASFTQGNSVVGTTWQVIANLLEGEKVPIATLLPEEGSTGWSDTWMVSAKAKHPNCMYKFMNHIISPETNAKATEYFGEAPANQKSCALTADKEHCTKFHATDEEYFKKVAYWKTPVKECGDSRGAVCKDYSEWVAAWTEIKG